MLICLLVHADAHNKHLHPQIHTPTDNTNTHTNTQTQMHTITHTHTNAQTNTHRHAPSQTILTHTHTHTQDHTPTETKLTNTPTHHIHTHTHTNNGHKGAYFILCISYKPPCYSFPLCCTLLLVQKNSTVMTRGCSHKAPASCFHLSRAPGRSPLRNSVSTGNSLELYQGHGRQKRTSTRDTYGVGV